MFQSALEAQTRRRSFPSASRGFWPGFLVRPALAGGDGQLGDATVDPRALSILGASVFFLTFAILAWTIRPSQDARPAPVAAASAPADGRDAAWVEVRRPFQMFDLTGGAYARLPLHYTAKRDEGGTARQDTLTYGDATPTSPFLRITFYRKGSERLARSSLFVDVARSGAEAGLSVIRSGVPTTLATRFGLFEVADMTLVGAGAKAACLGFRRVAVDGTDPLALSGVACDGARSLDRKALACTLDKLDLVSAGDDDDLQRFFVAAEQRRGLGCTGSGVEAADLSASAFPLSLKHSLGNEND